MTNPQEVIESLAAEREHTEKLAARDIVKSHRSALDVRWFTSGANTIGIVRTNYKSSTVKYYIGCCISGNSEIDDIAHIANYGARYPEKAGDALFGDSN